MATFVLLQQTAEETAPYWISFVREFGISTAILLSGLWFVYKYVAPVWLEYWRAEQAEIRKREEEQRQFLLNEIKRLQDDSREDKRNLLEAYKQNNETSIRVQTALEAMAKEIVEMRADTDKRLESVQRDVSEIYSIVGRDKRLIQVDTQNDR